jgi:drug/metabolite transporter (DMT)-like permease
VRLAGHLIRAIAWMGGTLLSFTAMAISVRELSYDMHAFEMLFIRSAIGVAILTPIVWAAGWQTLRTKHLAGHLMRNAVHFTGQVLWIFGIALLPLATVSAIEFTTPGMAVVGSGALIMLACAFFFGATNAITKWLTRSDSPVTIVFYMVLMQTLFGAVASIFVWTPVAAEAWPWLLLLAITGLSAHYCLTRALLAADASFVLPFEFLRLPLVALMGFLLYSEAIEAATLLGAALIFSGTTYSLRYESRR